MLTPAVPKITSIECLSSEVDGLEIDPGQGEIRFSLYDSVHSLPMYCIVVDSVLRFSVFVHNWPIREDHPVYQERKCSM